MAKVEFFLSNKVEDNAECICTYPTLDDVPHKYVKNCDKYLEGPVYLYKSEDKSCCEQEGPCCEQEEPCQDSCCAEYERLKEYFLNKAPTVLTDRELFVLVHYKDKNIVLDMGKEEYIQRYKLEIVGTGLPLKCPTYFYNPCLNDLESLVRDAVGYNVFISEELPSDYVDTCDVLCVLPVPTIKFETVKK